MLDHQGRRDSSGDETASVFGELSRLAEIIDATHFVSSAAILHSDDIGWAWNHAVSTSLLSVMNECDVSTQGRLLKWYTPLYGAKISVDILDPLRDLSAYKVIIAPNLYLITPEIVENLKRFIYGGGLAILGPKAALKDWANVFYSDLPPCGGLAEVFGVTVKPAPFRLSPDELTRQRVTVGKGAPFAGGMSFSNDGLLDYLEPAGAEAIAWHDNDDAAITMNRYGEGLAMYMGCEPEEAFYRCLIEWLVTTGKLEPVLMTDADVEVTLREGGGRRLIFVLNHNAEPTQIQLTRGYHELIADQQVSGVLVVEGHGAKILSDSSQ